VKLKSIYGSQLWTFAGLLLVFSVKLEMTADRWRRVWVGCGVAAGLFVAAAVIRNVAGPYSGSAHREHFPGKELAVEVERLWNDRCHCPLPVVAGDGWLAGNVALYGRDGALVYGTVDEMTPPASSSECAWMNDDQFARLGGVLLWHAGERRGMPPALRERYPHAEWVDVLSLRRRTGASVPPARIGVAIVRAEGDRSPVALQASRVAGPTHR
jgi:hypothetical protein